MMFQARVLLAAIALTVTVPSAQASIRSDCTPDALNYCASEIPRGRAAIIKCMVRNKNNLSPKCRQHIR